MIKEFIKSPDKQLHFITTFIITLVFGLINVLAGVIIAIIASFYKEYSDSQEANNYWSWGDLLADAIGIVAAILLLIL